MKERTVQASDLASVRLFGALHKSALSEIVSLGTIRVYEPEAPLYTAGAVNTKLIIILRGRATIGFDFEDYDVPIEILHEGSLWGYTTLLRPGKRYPYHVRSGDRVCETIELPISKILEFMNRASGSVRNSLVYELAQLQTERSSQRQKKVALLFGLAHLLNAHHSHRILPNILKLVTSMLNAERGLIASFNDTAKHILIEETHQYPSNIAQARYTMASDTVLSMLYHSGKSFTINKHTFERKFMAAPYARDTMLMVPLILQHVICGAILCADKKTGNGFTEEDSLILSACSPMLAIAFSGLHNERERENIKKINNDFIDPFSPL